MNASHSPSLMPSRADGSSQFHGLAMISKSDGLVQRHDNQALGGVVVCGWIGHVDNDTPVSSAGRPPKAAWRACLLVPPEQVADDIGCVAVARFEEVGVDVQCRR